MKHYDLKWEEISKIYLRYLSKSVLLSMLTPSKKIQESNWYAHGIVCNEKKKIYKHFY